MLLKKCQDLYLTILKGLTVKMIFCVAASSPLVENVKFSLSRLSMYQSNRSFNIPPPSIPRAFDAFSCPGGREFDRQP